MGWTRKRPLFPVFTPAHRHRCGRSRSVSPLAECPRSIRPLEPRSVDLLASCTGTDLGSVDASASAAAMVWSAPVSPGQGCPGLVWALLVCVWSSAQRADQGGGVQSARAPSRERSCVWPDAAAERGSRCRVQGSLHPRLDAQASRPWCPGADPHPFSGPVLGPSLVACGQERARNAPSCGHVRPALGQKEAHGRGPSCCRTATTWRREPFRASAVLTGLFAPGSGLVLSSCGSVLGFLPPGGGVQPAAGQKESPAGPCAAKQGFISGHERARNGPETGSIWAAVVSACIRAVQNMCTSVKNWTHQRLSV